MWRSFLSRSPPLLAHLRPIRHPCARSYGNVAGRRRRGAPNQPHLYVALQDSNGGHALYKLNEDDLAGDDSDMGSAVATGMKVPQRLPKPVLRLSYRSFGSAKFNALGSKIVVTTGREGSKCLTLVYDTKTTKKDIQPFLPDVLTRSYRTVVAGNKLYAFCPYSRRPGYYLRDPWAHPEADSDDDNTRASESASDSDELAPDKSGEGESKSNTDEYEFDDSDEEDDVDLLRAQAKGRWTWKRSPMSMPGGTGRESDSFYTASHAVHPDGRTIFLSTFDNFPVPRKAFDNYCPSKDKHGTFSLDTDQPGAGKWTRLGEWKLPFYVKADYDSELNAWVSFTHSEETDGQHLCSCDLPATGGNPTPQPSWRLCKEQLTFMQPPLSAMCRTIVHTGPGRFCLVEVAPYIRLNDRRCLDVDQDLLQVTMFSAQYGENGELMATPLRPGRLYLIPAYDPISIAQPPAFWM